MREGIGVKSVMSFAVDLWVITGFFADLALLCCTRAVIVPPFTIWQNGSVNLAPMRDLLRMFFWPIVNLIE